MLKTYFRSGWAFFIPYLAAYLLYAWLKWPVNPVVEGAGSREQGAGGWVPSLLHVYWVLHAVHIVLGAIAMRFWLRQTFLHHSPLSLLLKAAPWICLALIFLIPGIYLEWPSDPWEHLRRINEWRILDQVTAHSSWKKSSYFLPYSLTQHVTGLTQLSWLNFYYTAVCLLLSWQYYRLARAVGLSERASFVFVLLNALTFGNNIFSFYRYYGLSSSILAQIGAVALTRIVLDVASRGTKLNPDLGHEEAQKIAKKIPGKAAVPSPLEEPALSLSTVSLSNRSKGYSPLTACYPLLRLAGAALLLLPLIAFNHIQGIGIAGLGILAVIVWRLIEWRRSTVFWLGTAAVAASIAVVLWFPRHPALDEIYRPHGWLTGWYGFNFYSPSSPAFERSLQILGSLGILNLILAVLLVLRRNHVVGWLTLLPIVVLACPSFAIPFAQVLSSQGSPVDGILIFHRMLFFCGASLAMVTFAAPWLVNIRVEEIRNREMVTAPILPNALLWLGLAGAVSLSPGKSAYNRSWHAIHVPPRDLQLRSVAEAATSNSPSTSSENQLAIASLPVLEMQSVFSRASYASDFRRIQKPADLVMLERETGWLADLRAISAWAPAQDHDHSALQRDRTILVQRGETASARSRKMDLSPMAIAWMGLEPSLDEPGRPRGTVLSNALGRSAELFVSDLVPITRSRRYQLSSTLRESGTSPASNYLAVAWYNAEQRLLVSNVSRPDGAGNPAGWSNGTYSYYGLVGQPAAGQPTRHSISFGLGELADIPAEARYLRVGALLNYRSTPGVTVELSAVTLTETMPPSQVNAYIPAPESLNSPASQAGQLSMHWTGQHVALTFTGSRELRKALNQLAGP